MTTYVFDKCAMYGEAEFLGNLDIGCEDLTADQFSALRDKYVEKVRVLIEAYDPTLIWWPSLSEVWGVVGQTKADPEDFREWWMFGNDTGRWENAFLSAYDEVTE